MTSANSRASIVLLYARFLFMKLPEELGSYSPGNLCTTK